MRRRFDVRAASHGAAGIGLIVIFAEAGLVVLFQPDDSTSTIGICLLVVSISYAVAMLFFGFMTSVDDKD
jgi:hypothetical protein